MLDIHTHVFCWGENPREGFLSESTRRAWLTRLVIRLTGLNREHGDTRSEQIRNRLTRQVDQSQFDRVVVLAQAAVSRPAGTRKSCPVARSTRAGSMPCGSWNGVPRRVVG